MCFAIRREVTLEDHERDLAGLNGVHIELALPHRLEDHLAKRGNLDSLAACVEKLEISCPSVHAPQGRLSDAAFLSWARETVRFAETVKARVIVFHPESAPLLERPALQLLAVRHLMELQRDTAVRVAVETFGNRKRILRPEELGEKGMWMVLDTSHVFPERIAALIDGYHGCLAGIHLSEMRKEAATGETRPHLPVESYGLHVLMKLREKGWSGAVTLEYLPEYHHRLLQDRNALEALFENAKG